jgi:hypothetical protein
MHKKIANFDAPCPSCNLLVCLLHCQRARPLVFPGHCGSRGFSHALIGCNAGGNARWQGTAARRRATAPAKLQHLLSSITNDGIA